MFKLVITDDEGKTTVVPLVRDEITIGRKEGNTIRLTDRNVSRRHARLRKEGADFVLEDLGSYNGTRVNDTPLEGKVVLRPGDVVAIGDYTLTFQDEERVSAVPGGESERLLPPRLVLLTPPAPGAEYALTAERMRVGRGEDLDIWVNHRSISREHAVIEREGGRFRIRDLGSANGVKVNGKKVTERGLEPGDVLELGSVRFRFVGEGEEFVFDAEATLAIAPVSAAEDAGESPRRKGPMAMAGAIVLLGLVVGGLILLASGGESSREATVEAVEPSPEPNAEPPSAANSSAAGNEASAPNEENAEAARKVAACRSALQKGEPEEAVARATEALSLDASNAEAEACRREAEVMKADLARFEDGKRLLAAGDATGAFFRFAELSEDSPLRSSPEVQEAERAYAAQSLDRAREALDKGDQESALRHVQSILTLEHPPRAVLDEARKLQQQLKGMARVRPGSAPNARRAGVRGNAGRRPNPSRAHVAARTPRRHPPAVGPTVSSPSSGASPSSALDASERAQALQRCMLSGDQACLIRMLEGRARTERELRTLIEAYVARGAKSKARRAARRYCTQFRTRFTSQYCKLADTR